MSDNGRPPARFRFLAGILILATVLIWGTVSGWFGCDIR